MWHFVLGRGSNYKKCVSLNVGKYYNPQFNGHFGRFYHLMPPARALPSMLAPLHTRTAQLTRTYFVVINFQHFSTAGVKPVSIFPSPLCRVNNNRILGRRQQLIPALYLPTHNLLIVYILYKSVNSPKAHGPRAILPLTAYLAAEISITLSNRKKLNTFEHFYRPLFSICITN